MASLPTPASCANAETLADLLVTDLNASSAELRKKVPELLEKLVASGAIMKVDNEYRMQTREGSEWNQAHLESMNKLLSDAGKLGSERAQLLKTQCNDIFKKFKLTHGQSKVARDIDLTSELSSLPRAAPPSPSGCATAGKLRKKRWWTTLMPQATRRRWFTASSPASRPKT